VRDHRHAWERGLDRLAAMLEEDEKNEPQP